MSCGHCRDCVHWEWVGPDEESDRRRPVRWVKTGPGPMGQEARVLSGAWGHCRMAESKSGEPFAWNPAAVAVDSEQYAASLATRSDFGCVMFEPKDAS